LRAVLDPNVIISAALSKAGAPARLLLAWGDGAFETVTSPLLLAELRRALAYPKLRSRIPPCTADALVELLARSAIHVNDPAHIPLRSQDPNDDYLLALAAAEQAMLVTGDKHLLVLAERAPIITAAAFLDLIHD
jgi:putative PIN family toxin of toxin-antitoxin system